MGLNPENCWLFLETAVVDGGMDTTGSWYMMARHCRVSPITKDYLAPTFEQLCGSLQPELGRPPSLVRLLCLLLPTEICSLGKKAQIEERASTRLVL